MDAIVDMIGGSLWEVVKGWLGLGSMVIVLVELLRQAPRLKPHGLALSLVLGPAIGVMAYWISDGTWVNVPLHGEFAPEGHQDELRHMAGAGFLGLLGTAMAKAIHDLGIVGWAKGAAFAALSGKSNGGKEAP